EKPAPDTPDTPETPETPTDPTGPVHPGIPVAGWTTFSKASDARVIYVSASGDDKQNGQTEATAVRTPDRAYALIRDNSADWILSGRGDTYDLPADEKGDFRGWQKSGRSANEKIVIGAYGDLSRPRPVIHSNGRGGIEANGGKNAS